MILRNKFLSFLVACTIANSCFGEQNTVTVCAEGYYVAYCGSTEISFENIMRILTNQHFRLSNQCWAVDGSLTKAQHYQNIRAIFGIHECDNDSCNDIDSRIQRMDGDEVTEIGSVHYCKNVDNGIQNATVLQNWMDLVHPACLTAAMIDPDTSIGCQKCPDGGSTISASEYEVTQYHQETDPETGETKTVIDKGEWINFNTIADCFATTFSDGRGTFNITSNDDEENRCYYSY